MRSVSGYLGRGIWTASLVLDSTPSGRMGRVSRSDRILILSAFGRSPYQQLKRRSRLRPRNKNAIKGPDPCWVTSFTLTFEVALTLEPLPPCYNQGLNSCWGCDISPQPVSLAPISHALCFSCSLLLPLPPPILHGSECPLPSLGGQAVPVIQVPPTMIPPSPPQVFHVQIGAPPFVSARSSFKQRDRFFPGSDRLVVSVSTSVRFGIFDCQC